MQGGGANAYHPPAAVPGRMFPVGLNFSGSEDIAETLDVDELPGGNGRRR